MSELWDVSEMYSGQHFEISQFFCDIYVFMQGYFWKILTDNEQKSKLKYDCEVILFGKVFFFLGTIILPHFSLSHNFFLTNQKKFTLIVAGAMICIFCIAFSNTKISVWMSRIRGYTLKCNICVKITTKYFFFVSIS